jgi:hypothetical protein
MSGWSEASAGIFRTIYGGYEPSKHRVVVPGYVAWRDGPTTLCYANSVPSPHRLFENSGTVPSVDALVPPIGNLPRYQLATPKMEVIRPPFSRLLSAYL